MFRRVVTSLVLCCSVYLFTSGNSGCDDETTTPYTGLRKSVAVLPFTTPTFKLAEDSEVNISKELKELLETVIGLGDRYRVSQELPALNGADVSSIIGDQSVLIPLYGVPEKQEINDFALPSLFQLFGNAIDNDDKIRQFRRRPQFYLEAKVISFLLSNFTFAISVGFQNGIGITPGAPNGPGGTFYFNWARLDLSLTLRNPYTLSPLHTQTLEGGQATVSIDVTIPVYGIPIGLFFQYVEPLKIKVMELLKLGISRLDPFLESIPSEARVIALDQNQLILNAGRDANVFKGRRFDVFHQQFLFDEDGKFQGALERPYGEMEIVDTGNSAAAGRLTVTHPNGELPQVGDLVKEKPFDPPGSISP